MQDAFGTVVWIVAAVGAIAAIYTLIGTGASYRQIGSGGIAQDEDGHDGDDHEELRDEIRHHVVAQNARRRGRGAEPLDVEDEIVRRIRELS
jgi:hypothetical protein